MHCLWCMDEIQLSVSWGNLLFPTAADPLCDLCASKLEGLPTQVCHKCQRPSKTDQCPDCERWQWMYSGEDPLTKNVSVYRYNEFLQEIIAKWKYRGDYVLGEIFIREMKSVYHQQLRNELPEDTVLLPIPLSDERTNERAFNQAAQLSTYLPLEKVDGLKRAHSEKQSKKSRQERLSASNPFILENPIQKNVLLVDDIYTTGSTLRHAAELLITSGAPTVHALTLARG